MLNIPPNKLIQIFVLIFTVVIIFRSFKRNWFAEANDKKKDIKMKVEEKDPEYHNDFSKVPAGEPDDLIHPPRSIGWGHGVGDKTMYEDLERIGLVNKDEEEADKKKLDS